MMILMITLISTCVRVDKQVIRLKDVKLCIQKKCYVSHTYKIVFVKEFHSWLTLPIKGTFASCISYLCGMFRYVLVSERSWHLHPLCSYTCAHCSRTARADAHLSSPPYWHWPHPLPFCRTSDSPWVGCLGNRGCGVLPHHEPPLRWSTDQHLTCTYIQLPRSQIHCNSTEVHLDIEKLLRKMKGCFIASYLTIIFEDKQVRVLSFSLSKDTWKKKKKKFSCF